MVVADTTVTTRVAGARAAVALASELEISELRAVEVVAEVEAAAAAAGAAVVRAPGEVVAGQLLLPAAPRCRALPSEGAVAVDPDTPIAAAVLLITALGNVLHRVEILCMFLWSGLMLDNSYFLWCREPQGCSFVRASIILQLGLPLY